MAKDLYTGTTQIDTWVPTEFLKHQNCEKVLVLNGKLKIAKSKGTNNFKLKVKQVKFFKELRNINRQYLAWL